MRASLKLQNQPAYLTVLGLNVLAAYAMATVGAVQISAMLAGWSAFTTKGMPLAAAVLGLVTNHLVSSENKAHLIFWRLRDPQPGCRAFSDIGPKDPRVDMRRLAAMFGPLPIVPGDQNRLWYRLLQFHADDIRVARSHREYLLLRDCAVASIIFLITSATSIGALRAWDTASIIYALILGLQVCLTILAARNAGERFVGNVLAIAGQGDKEASQ